MREHIETCAPLTGARLQQIKRFLESRGLHYETDAELCAFMLDDGGEVVAAGCLDGNVLKYIAVGEEVCGTGACASIVSELVTNAYRMGRTHLFLYTKPSNEVMFRSLGFYPVAATAQVLMMENKRNGIDKFLSSINVPNKEKTGAVVANCDPFTNGHLYLIERAADMCGVLHLFVVSEDRAFYSAETRLELVRRGTAHLKNVYVHKSEQYLVSYATFPTYFIKDRACVENVQTDLDIALFGQRIAPALGIKTRFVGTEPFCPVTRMYNERMKQQLPRFGIELCEIERKDGISASAVRRAVSDGDWEVVRMLVPDSTYEYIRNNA